MISVLFFTHDDAPALARSLLPLVHEAVEGNVCEVIVIDGGSSDETREVADAAGCRFLSDGDGALRRAVETARGDWLIVLEPGARLRPGWAEAVFEHAAKPDAGSACFRTSPPGNWLHGWLAQLATGRGALTRGLVISRQQALATCGDARRSGEDLVRCVSPRQLAAWIEPAVA